MQKTHNAPEPDAPERESVGCPACGRTIGPAAQVCRYCGVNVAEFLADMRQRGWPGLETFDRQLELYRPSRAKMGCPALAVLGGALGLVLFVYLLGWER